MDIKVAFWNLGNLFDTKDDPISDDLDFTPGKGWTTETQKTKVANLAKVIDTMFYSTGPDLLGVCEVENEETLQQLVDAIEVRDDLVLMKYSDGKDIRGIDCALVYSSEIFEPLSFGDPEPPSPKGHLVHNRYPTRDIFEAPLRVKSNDAELIVYVNHWPSRSQGRYESEPLRIAAANHLGRLIDQRLKFTREQLAALQDSESSMTEVQKRWNRNILVMGDFNDEPFNRSVLEELKASSGFDKLEEPVKKSGDSTYLPDVVTYAELEPALFNCMWPVVAMPDRGSYFFGDSTPTMNVLDQFIVSRGLYYGNADLRMRRRTQVELPTQPDDPPKLVSLDTVWADVFDSDLMVTSKKKRRPKKFTFELKNGVATHNNGYSDHFPIVTAIEVL